MPLFSSILILVCPGSTFFDDMLILTFPDPYMNWFSASPLVCYIIGFSFSPLICIYLYVLIHIWTGSIFTNDMLIPIWSNLYMFSLGFLNTDMLFPFRSDLYMFWFLVSLLSWLYTYLFWSMRADKASFLYVLSDIWSTCHIITHLDLYIHWLKFPF